MINFKIIDWFYWGKYYCDVNSPNEKDYNKTVNLDGVSGLVRRRFPEVAKKINGFFLISNVEKSPIVYVSRDGQIRKTIDIIRDFKTDTSPAKFSLSVHNAVPGLLSATHQNKISYQTIDSLSGSIEMAIFEAVAMLECEQTVNVIYFEEKTPKEWQQINDNFLENSVVFGLKINKGKDYCLTLLEKSENCISEAKNIENTVQFLQQTTAKTLQTHYQRCDWQWQKLSK